MLDGKTKATQDRFWDKIGRVVAKTGISANQVTLLGVALVLANSAAYLWHRNSILCGLLLILFELLDDVDGAVARVTNTRSKLGAYLDAATDRYKDTAILIAIAAVHQLWIPVLFAATGGLLTSYNKARAGMEVPIDNDAWPDLFERFERVALVVTGLLLDPLIPASALGGHSFMTWCMGALAALTWLTSLQRLVRACRVVSDHERAAEPPE